MSGDIFSDDGGTAITVRPAKDPQPRTYQFLTDDHSQGATGSHPTSYTHASTSPAQNFHRQGSVDIKPQPNQVRRTPEARDDLRRLWGKAKRHSAEMVLAAESGDPIELSNSASDLDNVLRQMWYPGDFRETDWRSVLNFLQGVLKHTWKMSGGFETLSVRQCKAIEETIVHNLGPSTMDKENVTSTLKVLDGAGLDAWAAISGDPEE